MNRDRLNSALSYVLPARNEMTLSLKHSTPKNRIRERDRASKDRQLGLLTDDLPLTSIYATPSVCKQPGGDRWWNIRCGYNQRMFGGLYSTAERDKFLAHFKGRRDEIPLNEFAVVAERIIAEGYQAEQGVAA